MASVRQDTAAAGSETHPMTIEQLAGEVGMSVRNIRNHHSRGLLAPPEVRARVGYYSPEHVARLLSGSQDLATRLVGLRAAVTAPFDPEQPQVVTREELEQRFGEASPKDL